MAALPARRRDLSLTWGDRPCAPGQTMPGEGLDLEPLALYLEEIETTALRDLPGANLEDRSGDGPTFASRAETRAQTVAIATSEGDVSEERRARSTFTIHLASGRPGEAPYIMAQAGGVRDLDRLRAIHPPGEVAGRMVRALLEGKAAAPTPSGETTIILGPGASGILFHEACGHALWTTRRSTGWPGRGASTTRGGRRRGPC